MTILGTPSYITPQSSRSWLQPITSFKQNLLFLLAVLALALLHICTAHADVVLPSIDPNFANVKEINPKRDAGYVVGDVLDRTVIVTIKAPYELVKESLPIVGYEHRYKGQISGIELTKIQHEESKKSGAAEHTLHLGYQVFTTGKVAKPAALRAEILKIRNTKTKEVVQLRVPSFSFRISPLSVFGQVKLREEMSPFTPPLLLDDAKQQRNVKLLGVVLALAFLGLLYVFGVRAWLPRMGAPFARAYRDIRKLPNTPEGHKQAVSRIHQALNKTAETTVFSNTLEHLLDRKPAFVPVEKEIAQFFNLSNQVFFAESHATHGIAEPKSWLLQFCRHLRDCERGLTPNIQNKAA